MTLNKRFIAAVIVLLVLLVGVILLVRWDTSNSPSASGSAAPRIPAFTRPAAPNPGLAAQALPDNGKQPPWAAGLSVPPTLPATANPAPLKSAQRSPANAAGAQQNLIKLKTMQQDLAASIRDGKQPDPKKVVALLTEIKRTNGSTVAGVNLDAVLNNLEQSQKIQALAVEIQHETAKSGGPDKKVLAAYFEKLKQLQSQLRMDISAPQKTEAAK